MAKKRFLSKYDGQKHEWLKLAKLIVVVAVIALIAFNVVIGFFRVDGVSMEPTLEDNQVVLFWRLSHDFDKGDIVAIKMPSGDKYVKRVVAVEGDTIDIHDGNVYLNGELLDEPYAQGVTETTGTHVTYPYSIGADQLFVMGDNREDSVDSRTFGIVTTNAIKGRLLSNK